MDSVDSHSVAATAMCALGLWVGTNHLLAPRRNGKGGS